VDGLAGLRSGKWVVERAGGQTDIDELIGAARFSGQGSAVVPAGVRLDAAWTEGLLTVGNETMLRDYPGMLRDVRRWRGGVTAPENAVWLDNSTIIAAATLLDESRDPSLFTPLTVWDLALLVKAVVCFDRVYHFRHPDVDDAALNRLLGDDVLTPLRSPEEPGAKQALNDVWNLVDERIGDLRARIGSDTLDGRMVDALVTGWRTIARQPELRALDLLDRRSADANWRSPGQIRLKQIADATKIGTSRAISGGYAHWLSEVLTDENYRTLINQRVADLVELPYLPAVTRMPFRGLLNERKQAVSARLCAVGALDRAYAVPADGQGLTVPAFLAVAIRRSGRTRAGVWAAVAELRAQARQFRARRAELDRALASKDAQAVAGVAKALAISAQSLAGLVGDLTMESSTAVIERVAEGDLDQVALGAALFAAALQGLFKSSTASKVLLRLTRPHLYFLTRIRQESDRIIDAMPDAADIWEIPEREQDSFAERTREIGGLV
jgi:hypothetical protein